MPSFSHSCTTTVMVESGTVIRPTRWCFPTADHEEGEAAIKHLKCNSLKLSSGELHHLALCLSPHLFSMLLQAQLKCQSLYPKRPAPITYLDLNPSDHSSLDTKNTQLGASAA